MSPQLAQSGHATHLLSRQLTGRKRPLRYDGAVAANYPKRNLRPFPLPFVAGLLQKQLVIGSFNPRESVRMQLVAERGRK